MIRLTLTTNQQCGLQTDEPEIMRGYRLAWTEDGRAVEGTADAWREVKDTADHFARDWASQDWNDPIATALRALIRKINTALRKSGEKVYG